MLQNFEDKASPEQGPPRLKSLREAMEKAGLDAFLIPRADVHQGEYVADSDERLSWLTGFTGSAGFCIVTANKAGVFIDGRYRVQVKSQIDLDHFTPVPWPDVKAAEWLKEALPNGGIVGFDPWLHTPRDIETLEKGLAKTGIELQSGPNLVDQIWSDRPAPPLGQIEIYPDQFAGLTHQEKRQMLAADLKDLGQTAAIITLPDSLCWLLNIRGADVPRNPVVHGFAILHEDSHVSLFVNNEKLGKPVRDHLGNKVSIHPETDFATALGKLTGTIRVDPISAPLQVVNLIKTTTAAQTSIAFAEDPCILPKACKTPAEITATKAAHIRDGAALCRFLAWYDSQTPGAITEIDVVRKLESCRMETGQLRDISFDTIAGSGPNGALAHYRVSEASNRRIEDGDLLVLDGGGQYPDGTTDITRTLPMGHPGPDERSAFTRVLQGMIAMSRVRWPRGLAGRDLDVLARYPLWLADQDYNHGTGHGVGVFLSVHEGPQRLSKVSEVPLQPGMILSNEPGYYREGAFGIRIENLVVVCEASPLQGGDATDRLCFETLSYVPIDQCLIDPDMLSKAERDWLNTYHQTCRDLIGPHLTGADLDWLTQATEPL